MQIACDNIGKKYGDLTALRDIDLKVDKGDFLILLGPNGAGKTTLIKILSGLIGPTTGKATVGGEAVTDPAVRSKVGVISHKSFLYENLTAIENLVFYGELYGVPEVESKAMELLKSVELEERKDGLVKTFSRGMVQRLSIARALVADPEFIFLDEPFTGLDQHSTDIFRKLLVDMHLRGKTVIMITHDIPIAMTMATRAMILAGGRKVHDEPVSGMSEEEFRKIYSGKVGG